MILELDCGNSYIKWRIVDGLSELLAAEGIASHALELVDDLRGRELMAAIDRCRMVSVRGDLETAEIINTLTDALRVKVDSASPLSNAGGVINGYHDQQRLGVDRWLAIIAAYDLCKRACLVIDLGTAITVDLVAQDGLHLGGYIVPGAALLRGQLLAHARRIQYDVAESSLALSDLSPGRSTAEAVERGCLIMVRSYIATQMEYAEFYLGKDFTTFVTGGDLALASDLSSVLCVPDLVFRGLAKACP
ncbi:type III pantothenate kinase [Stutzerimonas stutzeri]|uniref:type III pantothenate kinase n=1 Tax=Stutzerimonas stutzeri TaxID=316 RepID=UPI002109380C|nr:type III pantothenate kinase [Stutzerimonas stutzeri]MCQ4261196.1 type III pantothenate kinase [Stutzerimonas stutzeri]